MSRNDRTNPLYLLFRELVQDSLAKEAPGRAMDDVEAYVTDLLFQFLRTDRVYAIKDQAGRGLTSVYEMLAEGDVRLNADTFEREREVHKHIGDYILFWSGVNPDYLRRLKLDNGRDLVCDYSLQGRQSYHVVSTFDYRPYDQEAPTFRKMSDGFDDLAAALGRIRRTLPFSAA